MPGDPFDFELPTHTPLRRTATIAVRPLLRRALRLNALSEIYATLHRRRRPAAESQPKNSIPFATDLLAALDITPTVDRRVEIPSNGALIVAANHPHGALDGLLLLDVIGRARPDVRLVANHWLARIPELRALCFFVDPFERHDSAHRSLPGLRAAHLWLRQGGTLVVFPAGEVAHSRGADGTATDSPWKSTVGRLATSTRAHVLPVHIGGGNSALFRAAGRVHPLLRTLLLPRELLNGRGRPVSLRLGAPLSPASLAVHGLTADAATQRIRHAVEQLRRPTALTGAAAPTPHGLPMPVDREALAADIDRLPADAKLVSGGALDVYCAAAPDLPHVLEEIGRLRELSFRAVGEGTGASSDLDTFDGHYLHLFVWSPQSREVIGGYRLGRADAIVAARGVQGLYTRTLFRYDAALMSRLPPALELGRSFVRPEYQRDHSALLLLWRGICAYVQRHPQYRLLFGAVSISARYSDRTRTMLLRFLEQNHLHHDLAGLVAAEHPYPRVGREPLPTVPNTIDAADALAARFEGDGRGMPVLLRHYLKLNARALGFSVDPSFGDVLDALMMVDLLDVDARLLRRYFGPAGARTFLEHHRSTPRAA